MTVLSPRRYAKVPWSDVAPSDLVEQGKPELVRDCRRERHLGLCVKGQYVDQLGVLAVRCERYGDDLIPISMAIALERWELPDVPPTSVVPPKRSWIRFEGAEDGA